MGKGVVRIGTRGSKLALWQAEYVAERLKMGGADTEILTIETKGDKMLDVTIGNIGGKGVFTEEIEEQLLMGTIDIAVHSAKDMPSELPPGLDLIAFAEREKTNDVLISDREDVSVLKGSRDWLIGTSSTRRVALLKHYFPHLKTVAVRGNLQTRLRKMREGQCDALLLAFAGVHRMGYDDLIREEMPSDLIGTPAGQGSVTVEAASNLEKWKWELLRKTVNHEETEICIRAERAFMKTMQGGCSIPVFVFAKISGRRLHVDGGIVSLDGTRMARKKIEGEIGDYLAIGQKLGHFVLDNGGHEILEQIKGRQ